MNMPKLNRYLVIIGGVMGVLCLAFIALEVGFIHMSFRSLNSDAMYNHLAIEALQKKTGTPAPTPVINPPTNQPKTTPFVDRVQDQLIDVLNENYLKKHVLRGTSNTVISFLNQSGFEPIQIRNSIMDKYPVRQLNWESIRVDGYTNNVLTLLQGDEGFPYRDDQSYLRYQIASTPKYGRPVLENPEQFCPDSPLPIKEAMRLMTSSDTEEEVCNGIQVYDASGNPAKLPENSTSTTDIYQFVYVQKSKGSDNNFEPPKAFIVMMGLNTYDAENILEIAASGGYWREGYLNKEENERANKELSQMVSDVLKSAHPAQCFYGYGSCY